MKDLNSLYRRFDDCPLCRTSNNKLRHVLGGGKKENPRVVFAFINPTHTNISSKPDYEGKRFPFIGVDRFWRLISESGWLDEDLVGKLQNWNKEDIELLDSNLSSEGIYITNLVKCTFPHGNYPNRRYFEYHEPLFKKELEIVKPNSIVAFGILTTENLTGETITFKKYFKDPFPLTYGPLGIPVYPCYFPVGRGNPKRAIEVLGKIRYLIE